LSIFLTQKRRGFDGCGVTASVTKEFGVRRQAVFRTTPLFEQEWGQCFRAWRGEKAVPRPAHSAVLVTALQIFRAERDTTIMSIMSIMSKKMKPWNTGKMPVPHPFARHVVAGEDARAPDSLLPFSPETRCFRTFLSPTIT